PPPAPARARNALGFTATVSTLWLPAAISRGRRAFARGLAIRLATFFFAVNLAFAANLVFAETFALALFTCFLLCFFVFFIFALFHRHTASAAMGSTPCPLFTHSTPFFQINKLQDPRVHAQ